MIKETNRKPKKGNKMENVDATRDSADIAAKEKAISQIVRDVTSKLNKQFEQWEGGLSFRSILSNYSVQAKKIGMTTTELSDELEKRGAIKVYNTPSGARFVFAANCPLEPSDIMSWLQLQDLKKDSEKAQKKAFKAQLKEQK